MALNQRAKITDNEILACRLAMADATMLELTSLILAIKEFALLALEGDEDGNQRTAIAELAGLAGYCIETFREDADIGLGMMPTRKWLRSPVYLGHRKEYKKAVAHAGGAA